MKKNSKVKYVILCVILFILGSLSVYSYFTFFAVKKTETVITVIDSGIADGIENIYDAAVAIENYSGSGNLRSIGSGFVYDKDGYIITNHHVIDNANTLKVVFMDGTSISARLIGSDEYADIAVLKIGKEYVKKVAIIGNSDNTRIGDTVFTIGTPMSSSYIGTVTRGILSGKNRLVEVSVTSSFNDWIMNVMQTDAAINPGNSGGPLCNANGEVIGVNSMKVSEDKIEGIGFAITIEDAIVYAENIVSGKKISRSYLGITMADVIASKTSLNKYGINIDKNIKSGVIVADIDTNGPAYKGGINKGDVIIKIGDYSVKNVAELRYYLYKYKPNERVSVTVIRGKNNKVFSVKLGESE